MTGVYRLADLNIEITSLYETIHEMCADYRAEEGCTPDFTVSTTQENIDFERERAALSDAVEGLPEQDYPDHWLETNAVHRQIAEKLPDCGAFLLHGSAVAVDGACYVFTARSGTGKSTHTRLWRELLGARAVMVNDDKPWVRIKGERAVVYGSPWDGKHHLSRNIAVPLRAVCILERAAENTIRPVSGTDALATLLQQIYRPADPAALERTLELIDRLCGCVSLYQLGCNMDIGAAELSYRTMRGGQAE